MEDSVRVGFIEREDEIYRLQSRFIAEIIEEKNKSIDELSAQIRELETNKNEMFELKTGFNDKIESLEVELTELKETKIFLEEQLSEQSQKLTEYENAVENLSKSNSATDNEILKYEHKIAQLENELKDLKESGENVNMLIAEKNAIIEEQGKRLSQVKMERTDKEIQLIKVKEQLEDYKNETEKLVSSKNNYVAEANRAFEEMEKLSVKLDEMQNEVEQKTAREDFEKRARSISETITAVSYTHLTLPTKRIV